MTNFLGGLKGSANMEIFLDKKKDQKYFKVRPPKGEKYKLPVYSGKDDLTGVLKVELKDTKKYEHLGIKIMLIGYLGKHPLMKEIYSDKNLST